MGRKENNMNPIFQTMLSRYDLRTKDDYTKALHKAMQDLKSPIFITAGQRPADKGNTNKLCLKGRTGKNTI
jgi:hypothetical protein